jgi:hypothetical protein
MVLATLTAGPLSREEAAALCGLPFDTVCKLQRIGIFGPKLGPEQLSEIIEELCAKGLPWPTPTRKSQWRPFPYTQPIWTKIGGGTPRLHARWRHPPEAQSIPHPFGTAPWITIWFSCERRRHAARQLATRLTNDKPEPLQDRPTPQPSHSLPARPTELVTQNGLPSDAVLHIGGTPLWEHQLPLYPDEQQLAAAVLGRNRAAEWPALAAHLERQGLPCLDPIFNARFWPSVLKFLLVRAGLDEGILTGVKSPALARVRVVPFAPDGKEVLDGEEASASLDSGRPNRPGRSRI